MLFRRVGVQVVESQPGVERQPVPRPLLLNEQSQIQLHVVGRRARRGAERDARRDGVREVQEHLGGGIDRVDAIAPEPVATHLEVVRPGHVRQRRSDAVVLTVLLDAARRGAIDDAQPAVVDADSIRRHLRTIDDDEVFGVPALADVDQHPGSGRPRPGRLVQLVPRRQLRRQRLPRGGRHLHVAVLWCVVRVDAELGVFGRLDGRASGEAVEPGDASRLLATEIAREDVVERIGIEIHPWRDVLNTRRLI